MAKVQIGKQTMTYNKRDAQIWEWFLVGISWIIQPKSQPVWLPYSPQLLVVITNNPHKISQILNMLPQIIIQIRHCKMLKTTPQFRFAYATPKNYNLSPR